FGVAGTPALLVTVAAFAVVVRSHGLESPAALLLANAAAMLAGLAVSLVSQSLFTFRGGTLFDGPAFRRFLLVGAGALAADEVMFAALYTFAARASDAPTSAAAGATLLAALLAHGLAFVALHAWGYRVFRVAPPPRPLLPLADAAPPPSAALDVELASIAA